MHQLQRWSHSDSRVMVTTVARFAHLGAGSGVCKISSHAVCRRAMSAPTQVRAYTGVRCWPSDSFPSNGTKNREFER